MPANPLTPEQLEDAARLKAAFIEFQHRRREAGERVTQEKAAAACGFGQSAFNQYVNGKIPLNLEALAKFVALLGVPPDEISPALAEEARGAAGVSLTTPAPAGMAQPMSLPEITMPPPTIAWEGLMNATDLPPEFRTAAPDDAMAPRLRTGQGLTLDTRLAPRPGDCVLIRDRTGGLHLRAFAPGVGRWEGRADNPAYPVLDSERDGLTVLGVLTALAGRWG